MAVARVHTSCHSALPASTGQPCANALSASVASSAAKLGSCGHAARSSRPRAASSPGAAAMGTIAGDKPAAGVGSGASVATHTGQTGQRPAQGTGACISLGVAQPPITTTRGTSAACSLRRKYEGSAWKINMRRVYNLRTGKFAGEHHGLGIFSGISGVRRGRADCVVDVAQKQKAG